MFVLFVCYNLVDPKRNATENSFFLVDKIMICEGIVDVPRKSSIQSKPRYFPLVNFF
jgi:hypothetical protein